MFRNLMIALSMLFFVGATTANATHVKVPELAMACSEKEPLLALYEAAKTSAANEELNFAMTSGKCRLMNLMRLNGEFFKEAKRLTPTVNDFEGDAMAVFSYTHVSKQVDYYAFIYNPDSLETVDDEAQAI